MDANPKQRRRHSARFKAEVIAACAEPGASVAAVARRFDVNDNLVHQWRRGRGAPVVAGTTASQARQRPAEFVALSVPAPACTAALRDAARSQDIRIEFERGGTAVSVSWPTALAGQCGAWLHELLRS